MASKNPLDWRDILTRTIVPGLLIALTGFVSERTLTSISSKQENARLVTELQIKREQSESDLRKDIFDHTVNALLGEERPARNVLGLSDRLLKLELLSLNFGDSLSLAPLFVEFERDLGGVEPIEGDADHNMRVAHLRGRLRSLARQVASAQLSALAQRGTVKSIRFKRSTDMGEYKWPLDAAEDHTGISLEELEKRREALEQPQGEPDQRQGELDGLGRSGQEDPPDEWKRYRGDPCAEGAPQGAWQAWECDCTILEEYRRELGTVMLLDVKRDLRLTFSDMDSNDETIKVDLEVCAHREPTGEICATRREVQRTSEPDGRSCVTRDFRLDFFNFPKIDNTRLSENQRFGLLLESFSEWNPEDAANSKTAQEFVVEVALVLFPAEYASLKDRPSMNEALKMLEKALDVSDGPRESSL